jgi:recombinational DNA repair ATPase RecF
MVTEFVNLKPLATTTEEQLISAIDNLVKNFWNTQDCFVDAELLKSIEQNELTLVFHFESMEKVKISGQKMRQTEEFAQFIALLVPDSLSIVFNNSLRKW